MGYFGVSEATIFSKRGSLRKGSESGSTASGFVEGKKIRSPFLRGDLACKIYR
jgi:hypothetical protein